MPLDLPGIHDPSIVTDEELIKGCAALMGALRTRGIIRTRNIVGDLGERYAVSAYAQLESDRQIVLSPANSTDVDAIDAAGTRFAIKAASPDSTRTSAFHLAFDRLESEKAFDQLIVVRINNQLHPTLVFELAWSQFWALKRWNKRQQAWFLPLTKATIREARTVFRAEETVIGTAIA